jgi:hypothetical protein
MYKRKAMVLPTFRAPTFTLILIVASISCAQSEDGIWPHETKNHIGEFAMVCGMIVGVRRESLAAPPESQPVTAGSTFLYFDKLPPHHEFVAIIKDHGAFLDKPEKFVDQKACVYGKIVKYKSMQAITLVRPDQLAVESMGKDGT